MFKGSWLFGLTLLAGLAMQAQSAVQPPVLNGIDVLESDHFVQLKTLAERHGGHLRIALMTDQAGRDNHDRRTVDVLATDAAAAVPGFKFVNLFSPEHGINGALDQHSIGNDHDSATGLEVISLFGATDAQRRPSKEQLANLDAILIDLQDVGVHYYTYESVVGRFLEAASGTNLDVVVLDRPNPIGGLAVQGIVSSPGRESYINFVSEPVRQGMTMGELARYFNTAKHLDAHLTVVEMRGWKRSDWFDATGQLWIDPSPNLRSLRQAVLYPGIGILERTNLSVGRGTDTPFEWIGAPWLDGRAAAAYLNARNIPGVRFIPVQFTPGQTYPFHGQLCNGVEFIVTDRDALDSPELGLEVASALYKLFPQTFQIDKIDQLLLNQGAVQALKAGEDPRNVTQSNRNALEEFKKRRAAALLYK
jgi:uncharacterized protein YbbC (DUF1343 family)